MFLIIQYHSNIWNQEDFFFKEINTKLIKVIKINFYSARRQ